MPKVKPEQYAQMLIEALEEKKDKRPPTGGIAERFWHLLQKNKQYRDLPKILELLDLEYAKRNGLTVAKVYSQKPLSTEEIKEIETKLTQKYSSNKSSVIPASSSVIPASSSVIPAKAGIQSLDPRVKPEDDSNNYQGSNHKFIIKNIIAQNIAGITVKVDDKVIDLSVSGRINNLKKRLINI